MRGTYDAVAAPPVPLAPPPKTTPAEETAAVVSAGLRGGFDSNPTLAKGGQSSGVLGADAAFAAGRIHDDVTYGVVGELARTEYTATGILPAERYRLALEIANTDQAAVALRSSSSVETIRTYNTRSFDAVQSVRAQWTQHSVRPFITGEVRYATLNETNAIFPEFFPDDQRFARYSIIPGVSYVSGNSEIGTSLNASLTRYDPSLDVFGFRRDNERFQPYAFFRYRGDDLSLFATLSRFYGFWHDSDFTDVKRTMYELQAAKEIDRFSLSLTLRRFAADTTFPISPITITNLSEGRVSYAIGERNSVTVLARGIETEYLDTPLYARTFTYGGGISHRWLDDIVVGLELTQSEGTNLVGEPVSASTIMLTMNRRFGEDKRAASLPPVPSVSRGATQPRIFSR